MFLQLNHQNLHVYTASREFVLECYRICNWLPDTEKYGMVQQIKRAALSVHLNISEGSSRKSETERKRFYEIARGSIVEIDAVLEMAIEFNYLKKVDLKTLAEKMVKCFKLLSGMLK